MAAGDRCDDRASHVALCVIIAGIVLVIIGCLWPLEPAYVIDSNLTAAENEALQEDYVWRRNTLFLVSTVGMACLVTGGIITSVLVIRLMCFEGLEREPLVPELQRGQTSQTGGHRQLSEELLSDEDILLQADHLQAKSSSYGSTQQATSSSNGSTQQ